MPHFTRPRIKCFLPVAGMFIVMPVQLLNADDISLKDEAPGFVQDINDFIADETSDRIGFTALGVQVYANRSFEVEDATFDPNTGVARAKGWIRYKTGPSAAVDVSCTLDFDIKYNIAAGELEGAKLEKDVNYIEPIRIDLGRIKRVFEGDLSAAIELIPNGGLVERKIWSEYDERKKQFEDKYGRDNVYFASSDFVRWAHPGTAGRWIIQLILGGGTTAEAIAAEARAKASRELKHMVIWLERRIGAAAEAAIESLLRGERIQLPQLKLVWQRVMYRSHLVVAGQSLPETNTPHAAFVLVWEDGSTPPASAQTDPAMHNEDNTPRPKWRLGARYAIGPTGCRIVFVSPGGAASRAGLAVGDVLTKIDGKPVGSADLTTDLLIRSVKKSDDGVVSVEFLRGSGTQTVDITLDPAI